MESIQSLVDERLSSRDFAHFRRPTTMGGTQTGQQSQTPPMGASSFGWTPQPAAVPQDEPLRVGKGATAYLMSPAGAYAARPANMSLGEIFVREVATQREQQQGQAGGKSALYDPSQSFALGRSTMPKS
jgi:hypothetical protein